MALTSAEWPAWSAHGVPGKGKRPKNIPARPDKNYCGKGWVSWSDLLGQEPRYGHQYWPFEQAREWVHKLELWRFRQKGGGLISWRKYCHKGLPGLPPRPPKYIPTHPDEIYADSGWNGWQDWVGNPQSKSRCSLLATKL